MKRREFYWLLGMSPWCVTAQSGSKHSFVPSLSLQINTAILRAVSLDGTCLAVYSKMPAESQTDRHDDLSVAPDGVSLHEITNWSRVAYLPTGRIPRTTEFFADSKLLMTQVPAGSASTDDRQLWITNPNTGTSESVLGMRSELWVSHHAYKENLCLCFQNHRNSLEAKNISLFNFQGQQSIAIEPWLPPNIRPGKYSHDSDIHMSDDKESFIYFVGRYLVCRNTANLSVRWVHEFPTETPVRETSVSADGSFVVAILHNGMLDDSPRPSVVAVLDGRSGKLIREASSAGRQHCAISPDGTLLAVGKRVRADAATDTFDLSVDLIDVSSNRILAELPHRRIERRMRALSTWFASHRGIYFTPDGIRLIVSGIGMDIWHLRPN